MHDPTRGQLVKLMPNRKRMLNGARKVPVIVEGGDVTIGFDGGT
jgi:hypothetical protein